MKLGFYKHFKGRVYEVIGVGRDSSDCTKQIVIYKSLINSDFPAGTIWCRGIEEFEDIHPIKKVKRFTYIGNCL